jgi:anti-sigma B factor antagonist
VCSRSFAVNRDPGFLTDPAGLNILVREQGTTTVIELRGEWDLAGLPPMRQAISTALGGVPDCLVLDLSRLGFIDSSGLHATIEFTERSAAQNTRLVIIAGTGPVRRMFETTGFLGRLPFIDERLTGSGATGLQPAQSGTAGPGAFSPQPNGASGRHQAGGRAPGGPLPGPHSHHPPAAERGRRPDTGNRP